jgi:hypothetical protein
MQFAISGNGNLPENGLDTYIRWLLALRVTLAGEGPPIMWVVAHRKHHRFSDQEHDPHSSRDGVWRSHMLWMLPRGGPQKWAQLYRTYAPDLARDRSMRFLDRPFLWWHAAFGAVFFSAGWHLWDLRTGVSLLLWGIFLRLLYVMWGGQFDGAQMGLPDLERGLSEEKRKTKSRISWRLAGSLLCAGVRRKVSYNY